MCLSLYFQAKQKKVKKTVSKARAAQDLEMVAYIAKKMSSTPTGEKEERFAKDTSATEHQHIDSVRK